MLSHTASKVSRVGLGLDLYSDLCIGTAGFGFASSLLRKGLWPYEVKGRTGLILSASFSAAVFR
jgi:hypothetical protein